jgi:hypothetical protein
MERGSTGIEKNTSLKLRHPQWEVRKIREMDEYWKKRTFELYSTHLVFKNDIKDNNYRGKITTNGYI